MKSNYKVYQVNLEGLSVIKQLFGGYVFRRVDEGVGYVKICDKKKEIIERYGIELKEQ